jgi:phage gpG-like protein
MDIRFSISDKEVLSALHRLAQSATPAQIRLAMREIGEVLTASTKRRFYTGTDPDGNRWPGLAQSTVLARLSNVSGAYSKKTGRISKKGSTAAMNLNPLVDTRELSTTIRYQIVNGGAAVDIGTNRTFDESADVGAEVHQFGTKNGRIPKRPFFGVSDLDKTSILDSLTRFLEARAHP